MYLFFFFFSFSVKLSAELVAIRHNIILRYNLYLNLLQHYLINDKITNCVFLKYNKYKMTINLNILYIR